jgi:hypothetical protein
MRAPGFNERISVICFLVCPKEAGNIVAPDFKALYLQKFFIS